MGIYNFPDLKIIDPNHKNMVAKETNKKCVQFKMSEHYLIEYVI